MKRVVVALSAFVLLFCHACYAAQKTIEWLDDLRCSNSISFDPKKYDEQKLRNTVDVIFTGLAFPDVSPSIPIHPTSPPSQQVELLQQRCDAAIRRGADLPVIDLTGIEAYRRQKLEELDDECKFDVIKIRAAYGDTAALRSYTSSAEKCSPFIDALEGKADIRAVWRGLVNTYCPNQAASGRCFYAKEGQVDEMDRIRYDVLEFGWTNCSTPYMKVNDTKRAEKMQTELRR
jgi:hypothetical protein